jgi:hypothetical protein
MSKEEMVGEALKKDSKERGHPHGFEDIEVIKEIIEDCKVQIERHKGIKELTKKKFDLMIKYPMPLKPQFEYEQQDGWRDIIVESHKLRLEPELASIDADIKGFEDRIKVMEQRIELHGDESKERKHMLEQLKEKIEKEEDNGNGKED